MWKTRVMAPAFALAAIFASVYLLIDSHKLSAENNWTIKRKLSGCTARILMMPAVQGRNFLFVELMDRDDKPICDSKVQVQALGRNGEVTLQSSLFSAGIHQASGIFPSGDCQMTLIIEEGERRRHRLNVTAVIPEYPATIKSRSSSAKIAPLRSPRNALF